MSSPIYEGGAFDDMSTYEEKRARKLSLLEGLLRHRKRKRGRAAVSETEESFLEFLYRLADPILRTEYTDVIMPMYFIWEDFFVIVMPCYALLACSY